MTLELAFPITPIDVNKKYVAEQKRVATSKLLLGLAKPSKLSCSVPLYHYRKSGSSGMLIASRNGKDVDFLYSYAALKLNKSSMLASEALAWNFSGASYEPVRGLAQEIFFWHLLPESRFVVSDYAYTDLGKKWFDKQYETAFNAGHNVWAIDLGAKEVEPVELSRQDFGELAKSYWGSEAVFAKFRFAISV